MSDHDRAAKIALLNDARIPIIGRTTSLALLGQQALRSVIVDRAYIDRGSLKSLVVRAGYDFEVDFNRYHQVFARFCTDLLLAGEAVYYAPASTIAWALEHHTYESDPMNPVLSKLGDGFICVPDLYSTEFRSAAAKQEVLSFLLDHTSRGGAIVVLQNFPTAIETGVDDSLSPLFDAVLASFDTYTIAKEAAK